MSGCPLHLSAMHGPRGLIEEDRAYRGARHSEVTAAILENPYQDVREADGDDPFPVYKSTSGGAFAGALPGGRNPNWCANRNDPSTAMRVDGQLRS